MSDTLNENERDVLEWANDPEMIAKVRASKPAAPSETPTNE